MIYTHNLSPVALDLGFIQVHWYGVMYMLAFFTAIGLAHLRRHRLNFTSAALWDCLFWLMLAIILGGRLGYMLFYNFGALVQNPLSLFFIWQGGMSFHGAVISVGVTFILFARSRGINPWDFSDFIMSVSTVGLAFGRLGNFINGELWGKETGGNWGVIFPHAPTQLPRHPSQLYELLLEGILLALILWVFTLKPKPRMMATGLFLFGYGLMRFLVEFVRIPDAHIGYLAFDWLTVGQLLSLPMIIGGMIIFVYGWRKSVIPNYGSA